MNPPSPDSAADDGSTLQLPREQLAPGDRFPDFALPDQAGKRLSFLERAKGNGCAVILDPTPEQTVSLAAKLAAYQGAGLDLLAIAAQSDGDPGFPVLADDTGKVRATLRQMAGWPQAGPLCLLLDRNQRLIAIDASQDPMRWALARWHGEKKEPAHVLGGTAPVLTLPNVLSPDQCRGFVRRFETEGHQEGTVHSIVKGEEVERLHPNLKKRLDQRVSDESVLKPLLGVLGRRIAPELDKAFCFRKFKFDRVLIACYDAERGDFFGRHRDNRSADTASRRFALTLNLNDEYDGGELVFPEYGDHRYKPPAGGAVLFSCSLLHEALPVTRGRRFAMLSFLRDP